jgi:hypothetical protein
MKLIKNKDNFLLDNKTKKSYIVSGWASALRYPDQPNPTSLMRGRVIYLIPIIDRNSL